jgi:hypothetical protein
MALTLAWRRWKRMCMSSIGGASMRADAAAPRVLAGAADREMTEFRGELRDFRQAIIASFNALRTEMTTQDARHARHRLVLSAPDWDSTYRRHDQ